MKSKTMILMGVAVVCGLAASYMTSRLLAERNAEKAAEEEKVKILVAKKNIPQGTFIRVPEDWFVEKDFVQGEEPKKAVKSFDEVKERILAKPVNAEQWVSVDDLWTKQQAGLQAVLSKGMRAVAIKVNIDTVVAGFVLPNSRVDVINTVRGEKEPYSQTILQNMLVLGIDGIDQRDPEKKNIVSSTVTLAVTPEEAMKLSLAQQMGELRLVLRPPDDTEKVNLKPTTPGDVRNARGQSGQGSGDEEPSTPSLVQKVPDVPAMDPVQAEQPPEAVVKKPPKKHTLLVINGESQTRAVFIEGDEDEPETQIQRSDPEPRPDRGPTVAPAPEKPAAPAAPAPEQPTKRHRGVK
jgi:pilus assembly protein CpaB